MGHFAAEKGVFTILFRTSSVVQISYLDRGKTINYQSHIKCCLKHLVYTLQEQRPKCGTKKLKSPHRQTTCLHQPKKVSKYN